MSSQSLILTVTAVLDDGTEVRMDASPISVAPKEVQQDFEHPKSGSLDIPSHVLYQLDSNPYIILWPTSKPSGTTYNNHPGNGIDIADKILTPIWAARGGKVIKIVTGKIEVEACQGSFSNVNSEACEDGLAAQKDGGYGNYIVIDHGNGLKTLYAHLEHTFVNLGDNLAAGQFIGAMGSTGKSTGDHLHFEYHKFNNETGKWEYFNIGQSESSWTRNPSDEKISIIYPELP